MPEICKYDDGSEFWLGLGPRSKGQRAKHGKEERKEGMEEAVEEKDDGQRGPATRYSAPMALSY